MIPDHIYQIAAPGSVVLVEGVESGRILWKDSRLEVMGWDMEGYDRLIVASDRARNIARDILLDKGDFSAWVDWRNEIPERYKTMYEPHFAAISVPLGPSEGKLNCPAQQSLRKTNLDPSGAGGSQLDPIRFDEYEEAIRGVAEEFYKFDQEQFVRQGSRFWMRIQKIKIETERIQRTLHKDHKKWEGVRLQSMVATVKQVRERISKESFLYVVTTLKSARQALKDYDVKIIKVE